MLKPIRSKTSLTDNSGMHTGVGGSLAITMRTYDPSRIQCNETTAEPPYQDECEDLVQTMSASSSPVQVFGPGVGRGVTVALPYTLVAPRK